MGLARAGRAGLSMARVWVFSPCEAEGEPRGTTPSVAAVPMFTGGFRSALRVRVLDFPYG